MGKGVAINGDKERLSARDDECMQYTNTHREFFYFLARMSDEHARPCWLPFFGANQRVTEKRENCSKIIEDNRIIIVCVCACRGKKWLLKRI